jgi:hypothetical protein
VSVRDCDIFFALFIIHLEQDLCQMCHVSTMPQSSNSNLVLPPSSNTESKTQGHLHTPQFFNSIQLPAVVVYLLRPRLTARRRVTNRVPISLDRNDSRVLPNRRTSTVPSQLVNSKTRKKKCKQTAMSSPLQSSTLDGLPKQFVTAMRTLFDIMDDKRSGLVNFSDIENRWQDDGSKGLPKGVLESLRKVTPPNGMLTFERFCAGLKICLLRNQVERRNDNNLKRASDVGVQPTNRPPSAPSWTSTALRSKTGTTPPPSGPTT